MENINLTKNEDIIPCIHLLRLENSHRIATVTAGWSSLVARRAHNPKVVGSNPAPATEYIENT